MRRCILGTSAGWIPLKSAPAPSFLTVPLKASTNPLYCTPSVSSGSAGTNSYLELAVGALVLQPNLDHINGHRGRFGDARRDGTIQDTSDRTLGFHLTPL